MPFTINDFAFNHQILTSKIIGHVVKPSNLLNSLLLKDITKVLVKFRVCNFGNLSIPQEINVIVAFGVSIMAVANNLMSEVKYNVEQFTGLDVEKVNVYIEGVKVVD